MSKLTEGDRADVAKFRQIQYDDQHKNAAGEKVFRRIPFDYVEYEKNTANIIAGWEPVDASINNEGVAGAIVAYNPSKHATSIQFRGEDTMFTQVGVGGDVTWPNG